METGKQQGIVVTPNSKLGFLIRRLIVVPFRNAYFAEKWTARPFSAGKAVAVEHFTQVVPKMRILHFMWKNWRMVPF
jgi:hypothetical protein